MLVVPPPQFPRRRARAKTLAAPAVPINRIASVTVQSDLQTVDILFSPGTAVTAVNGPDDNFFINYSGGQTASPTATIVTPTHVRLFLFDPIDAPADWQSNDEFLSFASGTFAGPYAGNVVFA